MFETEIQHGAALLDREGPPDWIDKVDLAQLDLRSPDRCILGQLYATQGRRAGITGYELAQSTLKLWGGGSVDHGFNTVGFTGFVNLTAEWREYIAQRRLAKTQRIEDRELIVI